MWYDADMMRERNDWLRRVFQGNSNPVFVSSNRVEPTGHSLLQTTVQPPSLSVDVSCLSPGCNSLSGTTLY